MKSFEELTKEIKGLQFLVGVKEAETPVYSDLKEITHFLVCGASGTGKSAFVESVILSIMQHNSPEAVKLLVINSTGIDYSGCCRTNHMLVPVVHDPNKVCRCLGWATIEVEKRLRIMSKSGLRKLSDYNDIAWESFSTELPRIVIVVDDFSHLLQDRPEVATYMAKLILNGRTLGIHVIAVTQSPMWKEAKKISSMFGARIMFATPSTAESRFILGKSGAEFLESPGFAKFVSSGSIKDVCTVLPNPLALAVAIAGMEHTTDYDEEVIHEIEQHAAEKEKQGKGAVAAAGSESCEDYDELLPAAIEVVLETGMASVSMLQRRLKLGYSRAAHLVDQMEEKGIVGPFDGSKPRQVLISKDGSSSAEVPSEIAEATQEGLVCSKVAPPNIIGGMQKERKNVCAEIGPIFVDQVEDAPKYTPLKNGRLRFVGGVLRFIKGVFIFVVALLVCFVGVWSRIFPLDEDIGKIVIPFWFTVVGIVLSVVVAVLLSKNRRPRK